ncbi:MAG: Ig-like domain-containing protein [Ruminococcus sp.]|nr:Ig-like domain-containing protein [Ruminococcus sp.]
MKKYLSILLIVLLVASVCSISAVAAQDKNVIVRIEGVDENLYYGNYTLTGDETVLDILKAIDTAEEGVSVVVEGGDYGDFVSAINGITTAKFGGWDGWQYAVNGVGPDVGMGSYKAADGDVIVIYYGDYPCPLPEINLEKLSSGEICFSSTITDWVDDGNGNYNPVTSVLPIDNAKVKLGDKDFTTDAEGKITFDSKDYTGSVSLQINKKSASGAPAVCRLAPDYKVDFAAEAVTEPETTVPETTVPETTVPETTVPDKVIKYSDTKKVVQPAVSVTAIKSLYVGQSKKIEVKNASGSVKYSSSNSKVAKVSADGTLTALKKGTSNITAAGKTFSVTVKNPKLNKSKIKLKKNKQFRIKVKGQSGKLSFKSKNKKVATVSAKGVVKAKSKGKTKITVTTNGMKLKLSVTVK